MVNKLENSIIEIIHEIGQVVVQAERPIISSTSTTNNNNKYILRDDETFAYFCDKAILPLLVNIVSAKPNSSNNNNNNIFSGIVWSSKVKSEILYTISSIIGHMNDYTAIYYMLSQYCINQLIQTILPLSQWTDTALLEDILPAYIELLKTLSLLLVDSTKELYPFFLITTTTQQQEDNSKTITTLPLFTAMVQVTTSKCIQSDSYLYASCLNLIVGTIRISDTNIRQTITSNIQIIQQLCQHINDRLIERYRKITNISTGPVIDPVRSKAIAIQFDILQDDIDVINDIFNCNNLLINMTLSEILIQQFITILLHALLPGQRQFLHNVGIADMDVIPEPEASVQVATCILAHFFQYINYNPFFRMIAVAVFHPKTIVPLLPVVSQSQQPTSITNKSFQITRALNTLVSDNDQNDNSNNDKNETADNIKPNNPFREEIFRALSGTYGEWRVIASSSILMQFLSAVDNETLNKLEMIQIKEETSQQKSCLVNTLETFFIHHDHKYKSQVSITALQYTSILVLQFIHKMKSISGIHDNINIIKLPLLKAVETTRSYFYEKSLQQCQSALQVRDVFTDLVEAEVRSKYKRITTTEGKTIINKYEYSLSLLGCVPVQEMLVRSVRGVDHVSDLDTTRFYIQMAIHFRAICRIKNKLWNDEEETLANFNFADTSGDLSSIFSCLVDKPPVGTELDLYGRKIFHFFTEVNDNNHIESSIIEQDKESCGSGGGIITNNAQKMTATHVRSGDGSVILASSRLTLVLDPTDLYVVKVTSPTTTGRCNSHRGIILCSISLVDVVAAASDGARLHVAVKHDNLGFLIKNGNMILVFDTVSACLTATKYLEQCRNILRKEMYEKIIQMFQDDVGKK